jgi:hypothetical protein
MVRKYIPHIFGVGILLALITFGGLQGNCGPADTLKCSELKVSDGTFMLTGQMKQTVNEVNLAKYSPEMYFVNPDGTTKSLSCVPKVYSFTKPTVTINIQCPTALDKITMGESVLMKWKVETKQPYSDQALYDEEGWPKISNDAEPRVCNKVGDLLVCDVVLTAKIPS